MGKNMAVSNDILRYKKNKLASLFAIGGLVFNCLYFMLFYSINNSSLYKLLIGFSVVLTLAVLLVAFYSSESVKNYKKIFVAVLAVLAAVQIARIFIYPLQVIKITEELRAAQPGGEAKYVTFYFGAGLTPSAAGSLLIVYLALSAACFVCSSVIGYVYATRLEKHVKAIQSGEIDIDAVLKETDAFAIGVSDGLVDDALKSAVTEEEEVR